VRQTEDDNYPAGWLPAIQRGAIIMSVPALLRVAAILHWIIAVGFGVFCLPAIRNLLILLSWQALR
jgi:hypothetical protein